MEKGLSQRELAEAVGIAQTNVSQWERDGALPKPRNIRRIAEVLGKPVAYFFQDEDRPSPTVGTAVEAILSDSATLVPLVATVPMGDPQEAIESTDTFVRVTPAEAGQCDYAFRVVGSSMWPYFWDGDMVGVRLAEQAEDRQIVIARLESGECTLKMYRQDPTTLDSWLEPLNKSLPKIREDFAVRGLVVWIRKMLPGGKLPSPA